VTVQIHNTFILEEVQCTCFFYCRVILAHSPPSPPAITAPSLPLSLSLSSLCIRITTCIYKLTEERGSYVEPI
jgi:hypothetical protein